MVQNVQKDIGEMYTSFPQFSSPWETLDTNSFCILPEVL